MPFRHLLPMADEMRRHKAQAMLRGISIARLGQSDPKDSSFTTAIADLREQAEGAKLGEEAPPMTVEQVRATMSVLGFEEV